MNTRCLVTRMALLIGLPAALALSMTVPQSVRAAGTVRYAAPNGASTGNCDGSWANACTLQRALAVAVSGDEIWVKKGVHYPGTSRTDTFTLKNGVAVYGGFAGTETSRNQRNWQTHKTILSGDIDHDDINTDGNNIAETWNDIQGANAYHVVSDVGTDNTAVLDGFVITAGLATGQQWPSERGGGVFNSGGSPKITNVTFSGNYATDYGSGMSNMTSSPILMNVTFTGNRALSAGGGMYNWHSSPTLTNVTFSNNSSPDGGGMDNDNSSPTLTNVTFSVNFAINYGGGMRNYSSNPTLTNVTFSGNTASYGGGMDNEGSSSPTLTNVTFSGNTASVGGGMYNGSSNPTLTNVTFSGNTASYDGGGMRNDSSNPTLTNVIMWGNTATNGQGIYNSSSTPIISYSNIQGCGSSSGFWVIACGTNGGGNIAGDPRFEDADGADNTPGTADDNLRLQLTSPCIDAGKNAAVPAGVTTDLDSNPRFVDIPTVPDKGSGAPPIVDMGAYEAMLKVFLPLALRND